MAKTTYRALKDNELKTLAQHDCTSDDWSRVQVSDPFDPARLRDSHFAGDVRVGSVTGTTTTSTGLTKPAGIYNAYIADCTIGNNVRIANIGAHLASYDVGDNACIEDVGTMQTQPGASFGNGVEIESLNEGGGREIILFNELSSQIAYLMCVHRFRPKFIDKLNTIARTAAAAVKGNRGRVGTGTRVSSVKRIIDVNIGDYAVIDAAASLVNGTVLSAQDAPTTIGADVQAEKFIIGEGSQVTSGAIVNKSFVGQGCQIGKQFSAEGSAFFANCEGFHGEACSIFAGPYTVTHHKSTLLIAGMFSFYNAGSGTNQSNHMYKLGPLHEGKIERGSKTGSFAYMMWPCRVGPFSVVLGKHKGTFDTSDLPFSFLDATPTGKCSLIPGLNLSTVGTVRDGAKWPTRDRRKGAVKRDRISFDVFSPLTVGRMIRGSAMLGEISDKTAKDVDSINFNGADIKRVLLRTGQKFYRSGIHMYLHEKVLARAEQGGGKALVSPAGAVYSEDWLDIGGQMMPRKRLDDLCADVESGKIADFPSLNAALDKIHAAYADDEWVWVKQAYKQVFGQDVDAMTTDDIAKVAQALLDVKRRFLKVILGDASKEFGEITQTGFGHDGTPDDVAKDFAAVRGNYETNKFVKQIEDQIKELEQRVEKFKGQMANA